MSNLEPPDTHHLSAAAGWLELGNPSEAGNEIARVSPAFINHPDVLEVRWAICVAQKSWEAALNVAEILLSQAPERAAAWIDRAYAMRRAQDGGLQQAWDALRPAFERFPKVSVIPYNLACYAAQMGRPDEAWEWLHKATEAADVESVKRMALADSDLEALWHRIREL
jgi:tetratricopeptide (TPR) repeat protein